MSTVPRSNQPQKPAPHAHVAAKPPVKSTAAKSGAPKHKPPVGPLMLFDRVNYLWMIGGVVLILSGFFLMSGGKSLDPHKFLYDEIYSFRRVTLAPIILLIGFGVEFHAIMRRPRTANPNGDVVHAA